MAINAYTGLMGSGKSYEAVSSVILPAILAGRNVVTNIDGVNEQLIHEYLAKKNNVEISSLGKIIHVANDDVVRPNFFPNDETHDHSIVKFGDMVVIDEAWRFWATGGDKISDEHLQFFRMHRHYVNPKTNVACDLILLVQSIGDLIRPLKAVVELTAVTTKLKTVGLNSRYRIDLYEGSRVTKATKFDSHQKKYDKEIFPLYASYKAGQKGEEKAIDKRQNILKNKTLLWVAIGIVLTASLSIYFVSSFFGTKTKNKSTEVVQAQPQVPNVNAPLPPLPIPPPVQGNFRIAGEVIIHGETYVLISDHNQRLRFEMPSAFVNKGMLQVGTVDGQKTSSFSGVLYSAKNNSIDKAMGLSK